MNRFSIKDIENLTGIKAHTIRIWEQRYGVLQPKRTDTNIRYYDEDGLKTALQISMLNHAGYKISRIGQMTPSDMETLISKIGDVEFQTTVQVNKLLEYALSMQPFAFEKVLNAYIRRHGLEHTVESLIFHFLQKVGMMWMVSKLAPAQEHMTSAIISRKLQAAINDLPFDEQPNENPVLLFLPEGEIHELGLLYVYYLMRRRNIPCVYLGSNLPVADAVLVSKATGSRRAYVHLTSSSLPGEPARSIRAMAKALPGTTFNISGHILREPKLPKLANIRYVGSLTNVHALINDMAV